MTTHFDDLGGARSLSELARDVEDEG